MQSSGNKAYLTALEKISYLESTVDELQAKVDSLSDQLMVCIKYIKVSERTFTSDDSTETCDIGYERDNKKYKIKLTQSSTTKTLFEGDYSNVKMPILRDNLISSYDSVVIDTSGYLGIPSSDEENKYDITKLSDVLDKVMKVNPISFRWKLNNKKAIGFLNKELRENLGIKGVHELISIVAILWQAVKELHEKSHKENTVLSMDLREE